MHFIAEIDIMPLPNLLDPQGKTLHNTLSNIGYNNIVDIRFGKHISLTLIAENKEQAEKQVKEIAQKILINPIVQYYSFLLKEAEEK